MRDGATTDDGWQRVLALSIVPLTVALGIATAVWRMRAGVEPATAVAPIGVAVFLLVALMERILPWHRDWNHSRGDLGSDALYIPTQLAVGAIFRPLIASVAVAAGGWISQHMQGGIWPGGWPLAAQVILASVVREFFDYWGHRAMHRFDWLWRLHATHHSASRLYWLNGARAHPGEISFRFGILGVLPLAILGVSEEVLALTTVAALSADAFQHANIAFRLGPLSWLYSIGDAHRWHHSRSRFEADNNYGNVYLFWDALFGTRYLPTDREAPTQVGIDGLDAFPRAFLAQWLSPFRWSRIQRESARLDT
jgi:sterol desaturase/sphingolipid hydroxylase (fatty acid hydroxylase superfamily)